MGPSYSRSNVWQETFQIEGHLLVLGMAVATSVSGLVDLTCIRRLVFVCLLACLLQLGDDVAHRGGSCVQAKQVLHALMTTGKTSRSRSILDCKILHVGDFLDEMP